MGPSSGSVFRDRLRSLYFILFVAGQWHDWEHGTGTTVLWENCGSKWRDTQAKKDREQPEPTAEADRTGPKLQQIAVKWRTRNTRELIRTL